MTSAACCVVGDEILTGKVHDVNSHVLAKVLFDRGVKLRRVEVIPDVVDEIAATVRRLSSSFDVVFTSGGIGPTHDDVTYEGVAAAFGRPLVFHAPTLDLMAAHYAAKGRALNDASRRMALVPDGCVVWSTPGLWVPFVVVQNVHVLPGIPLLFEQMLVAHAARFTGPAIRRVLVFTQLLEGDIADALTAAARTHPAVAIGSYPRLNEPDHKVMVSFEGEDAAEVDALADEVSARIHGFRRA